jgi:hypothetical protein
LAERRNVTMISTYAKSLTEHPDKSNVGMYTHCLCDTQLETPCLSVTPPPPPRAVGPLAAAYFVIAVNRPFSDVRNWWTKI